ncbi:Panacea domain-containing protein [Desulfitobacterium sp.]|uniref:Panacea domain-containing protein n=1 Tax=Desulfitobacterium sp. TaxID=49981 RepID=UPI002B7D298D|nr:Panacea domain-containing protein [Desulfitobacterium sp.]HVJ50598.1 Panacea domain-containing protein [Desulfitobacterium sp.]
MTIGSLYSLIEMIYQIKPPGKKTLQKLVYLIQEKGANLGYQYCIHYYGPYSSVLDYSLQSLERLGIIKLKRQGMGSLIIPNSMQDILTEEEDVSKLSEMDMEIIKYVLEKFAHRSPKELELITTTDFVAKDIFRKKGYVNKMEIINGVIHIKDTKFSQLEIENAIDLLLEEGYLDLKQRYIC